VRAEGINGILVEEVVVKGIVQTRGAWVAMIATPSGRTYSVRPGDRLMDGNVRTITAQSVVLLQEVNDPLSLEKQREVRKFLRGEVK
jgi:Tfp pilus assembly protein PilP